MSGLDNVNIQGVNEDKRHEIKDNLICRRPCNFYEINWQLLS